MVNVGSIVCPSFSGSTAADRKSARPFDPTDTGASRILLDPVRTSA